MKPTAEPTVPANFYHRENSPTAASIGNRLFGSSGRMPYRVTIAGPMGMTAEDFDAETGDDAASLALTKYVGAKVAKVEPAPRLQEAA